MTHDGPQIIGGVDTHGLTHHVAVLDTVGRHLVDREFPATIGSYRNLPDRMRTHGTLVAVSMEGTEAYGAELARVLTAARITVLEVDRPDRRIRRPRGLPRTDQHTHRTTHSNQPHSCGLTTTRASRRSRRRPALRPDEADSA